MIKQETAREIYNAYREIETAEKLLKDVEEAQENYDADQKKTDPCLKNAFGRFRHFEMGIPSGESGHRIFTVRPNLARAVILAHIEDKKSELLAVQERAKIEAENNEVKNEC